MRVAHGLMMGLGFKEYAAQGGDLGAFVSRLLACRYDECKGELSATKSRTILTP